MKISIVTISYNQASFLERAIRSVIDQDHKDVEYIVVDPGSTDGSRDIIEKYRARISRIVLEPDDGPADGLNKGFSHATGEIYGFLNSDDVLLPGALQKVSNYFAAHQNIDVVSGHAAILDADDRLIRNGYSGNFSLIKHAYGVVVLMQPSTFFRSERFKATSGFNRMNRVTWDGELWVDMAKVGATFALMNEMLSGFRLHPQSITSSARLDELHRFYQKYIFRKITGKEWRKSDVVIRALLRVKKHIAGPRAFYERLRKGPIYGRDALRSSGNPHVKV